MEDEERACKKDEEDLIFDWIINFLLMCRKG